MLKRRFWISVSLGILLVLLHASHDYVGGHGYTRMWIEWLRWAELALATVAVLWCGQPLLARLLARRVDGPALTALAAVAICGYGLLALLAPELWPRAWREVHGMVPMRFELASGATTLALLAELLRARRPGNRGGYR
jgi:Cu+-exporting ATPase